MAPVSGKQVTAGTAVAPSAAGAALGVASVTLASRVLGFVREAALAAVFGASRASDAYLVATVIPSFLVMALNSALVTVGIPVLSEYLHRSERRPRLEALVWSSFHVVALALVLLTLLAWPLAPWVVRGLAPGFEAVQAALTTALVRIVLPSTLFLGLAGWAQAVLNVHRHFLVPAAVGTPGT